jgi:formamidopyrimidine-DNA glycosylase
MPELPEVETVARGLRDTIIDQTIARVVNNAPVTSVVVSPTLGTLDLQAALKGRRVESVDRRGKNILVNMSGGVTLWVHLKMTGHMFWLPRSAPVAKHDLVLFDFESSLVHPDSYHLRFNDYRRFGRLRVYPTDELFDQPGLAELGPEPLELGRRDFVTLCRGSHRMIKPALLDQSFIAGLGNIYADEALYYSRLHPRRLTDSVSPRKLGELHSHIQYLLRRSIELMGTSVDSYSGVNGQTGRFQTYLKAYNSEGRPCERCSRLIVREKIGSRSAHYCPQCQRRPRVLVTR